MKAEKTLGLGASEMDILMFGEGKTPLVIICGMSFSGLRGLLPAVEAEYAAYRDRFRFYILDRPRTLSPGSGISDYAADIAAAMDLLSIENAAVYGVSQGGMIALTLAAVRPDLVSALVLASSCLCLRETGIETMTVWRDLAAAGQSEALSRDFAARVYGFIPPALPAVSPDALTRFSILASACLRFDGTPLLPRITCPRLVLGSPDDRVFGGESSGALAEALHCECFLFPGGHAVYDSSHALFAKIAEFLS